MNRKTTSCVAASMLAVCLVLAITSCTGKGASSAGARAPGTVTVDLLYLNHAPVLPILAEVDKVLNAYAGVVTVTRYDFDTPQGQAFAKKKKITGHVPLVVFINGSQVADLGGRKVTFQSFPKGEGPGMIPDGDWSVADLDAAVKAATGK